MVLRAVRDLARTVAVDHAAIVAAFLVRNSHLRNYSANPPQRTTNAAAGRSSPVQLTRLPLGAPWSGLELDPHGSYIALFGQYCQSFTPVRVCLPFSLALYFRCLVQSSFLILHHSFQTLPVTILQCVSPYLSSLPALLENLTIRNRLPAGNWVESIASDDSLERLQWSCLIPQPTTDVRPREKKLP